MKSNIEKAKQIIKTTDAVFAYVYEDEIITSDMKGIGFVSRLCNEGKDLSKGAVADKIVGKAAALLFVLLGVKAVFAETLSLGARAVLEEYGIEYGYDILANAIVNRKGDGLCPMENAVKDINNPKEALAAVNKTLENLRNAMN